MMQGAQAQANMYAGVGHSLAQGITDWGKVERERAKMAGAAEGLLSNPFVLQKMKSDPRSAELMTKIGEGKGNLRDLEAFTAKGATLLAEQKRQQDQEAFELNKKATEERIRTDEVQRGYIQGQIDAQKRMQQEAEKRAAAVRGAFAPVRETTSAPEAFMSRGKAPIADATLAQFGSLPTRAPTTAEAFRRYQTSGVPLDEASLGAFKLQSALEQFPVETRLKQSAQANKDAIERQKLLLQEQGLRIKFLSAAEAKGQLANYTRSLEDQVKQGIITKEEALDLLKTATKNAGKMGTQDSVVSYLESLRNQIPRASDGKAPSAAASILDKYGVGRD
jgi:hypothetical protein